METGNKATDWGGKRKAGEEGREKDEDQLHKKDESHFSSSGLFCHLELLIHAQSHTNGGESMQQCDCDIQRSLAHPLSSRGGELGYECKSPPPQS